MRTFTKQERKEKLRQAATIAGFETVMNMLEEAATDSICTCVCMNVGCNWIEDYEPDQTEGWCENCDDNSMVSVLVLAGMI